MRGYALHRWLAGASTLLGDARVRGTLLDLKTYPGLVDGKGWVSGELYRLHDRELLPILDRQEGYNFERLRAGVVLTDGRRSRAYQVMAVPKIVMNDRVQFEGALPEAQFLEAVLRAAGDGER